MIDSPGRIRPSRSAASIIDKAMRSLDAAAGVLLLALAEHRAAARLRQATQAQERSSADEREQVGDGADGLCTSPFYRESRGKRSRLVRGFAVATKVLAERRLAARPV